MVTKIIIIIYLGIFIHHDFAENYVDKMSTHYSLKL